MAERKSRHREAAGRLTPELQCELDALRAFADLVEIAVVQVEGKPWDLHSRYWRPMINALRQAQGKPIMQMERQLAMGGPETAATTEKEDEA